jgi:mannitol 2-dehydrogenase
MVPRPFRDVTSNERRLVRIGDPVWETGRVIVDVQALDALDERGVDVPRYDRRALVPRIVHIGVGGFHRSHLAVYCDDLAAGGSDWGICGIGLLDADRTMAGVLARQDHLYTLTTRHGDTVRTRIIGSIVDYVLATDDTSIVGERIAAETTEIVSLTVTEAGYAATARNDRTFDTIVAGLARRRRDGLGGVTVMSCDNMTGNGDAARRCVLDAAHRSDPSLGVWIESNCTFPNSMVDRITPATTDDDRTYLLDAYGLRDEWPVVSEPFRQWVIEDAFATGRPDLAAVGAIVTDDVHLWELYKLRLLNAGHTVIAHLAALASIRHVDEALGVVELRSFLEAFLLEEAAPTLEPIPGHPPSQYVAGVLERFANTGIRDGIDRICTDSTAKFATFVMPILVDQLERDGSVDHLAHALAAWTHYLAATPVDQQAPDPAGDTVRSLARAAAGGPAAFLDERAGFPPRTLGDTRLTTAYTGAHQAIAAHGALGALRRLTRRPA